MKDQWHGGRRDLVKWSILLEIARNRGCLHILQVLYYRPTLWSQLEIGGKRVAPSTEVIRHFRDAATISKLTDDVLIEIIPDEFRDRIEYNKIVLERLRKRAVSKSVIFLDPDTGLEPAGNAGLQHVLEREVKAIWEALSVGDVLVLYQHKTGRNNAPWIPAERVQFEDAIGVTSNLGWAPEIANDVAFFFAEKNESALQSSHAAYIRRNP